MKTFVLSPNIPFALLTATCISLLSVESNAAAIKSALRSLSSSPPPVRSICCRQDADSPFQKYATNLCNGLEKLHKFFKYNKTECNNCMDKKLGEPQHPCSYPCNQNKLLCSHQISLPSLYWGESVSIEDLEDFLTDGHLCPPKDIACKTGKKRLGDAQMQGKPYDSELGYHDFPSLANTLDDFGRGEIYEQREIYEHCLQSLPDNCHDFWYHNGCVCKQGGIEHAVSPYSLPMNGDLDDNRLDMHDMMSYGYTCLKDKGDTEIADFHCNLDYKKCLVQFNVWAFNNCQQSDFITGLRNSDGGYRFFCCRGGARARYFRVPEALRDFTFLASLSMVEGSPEESGEEIIKSSQAYEGHLLVTDCLYLAQHENKPNCKAVYINSQNTCSCAASISVGRGMKRVYKRQWQFPGGIVSKAISEFGTEERFRNTP